MRHGYMSNSATNNRQRRSIDRHIRLKLENAGQRLVGIAEQHADLDGRILSEKARDHFRGVEGTDCGDAQLPSGQLATAQKQFVGLFVQLHDAAADIEQRRTRLGQFDPAAEPQQQLHAVTLLEFLYLCRHRRLADAQRVGCGCETTILGHGVKGTEVGENYSHGQ